MYSTGQAYKKFVQGYSGAPGFLGRAREPGEEGMHAAWSLPYTPTLLPWRHPSTTMGWDTAACQAGPGHGHQHPCRWMGCVPSTILATVAFALWATRYPKKIFWVHSLAELHHTPVPRWHGRLQGELQCSSRGKRVLRKQGSP